jgi:hypothetical protein
LKPARVIAARGKTPNFVDFDIGMDGCVVGVTVDGNVVSSAKCRQKLRFAQGLEIVELKHEFNRGMCVGVSDFLKLLLTRGFFVYSSVASVYCKSRGQSMRRVCSDPEGNADTTTHCTQFNACSCQTGRFRA